MGYIKALGATDAAAKPASTTALHDLVSSPTTKTVSGVALVFHGYRRTGSIVWALLYGLAGRTVPVVAVPVAIAQGYGKKRSCP